MEEQIEIVNPLREIIKTLDKSKQIDKDKIISELISADKKFEFFQSFFVSAVLISKEQEEKYKDFQNDVTKTLGKLIGQYIQSEFDGLNAGDKIVNAFSKHPSLVCPFIRSADVNVTDKEVTISVNKCCISGLINNICLFSKLLFENIFIREFQNMLIETKFTKEDKLCSCFIKIQKMKLYEEL